MSIIYNFLGVLVGTYIFIQLQKMVTQELYTPSLLVRAMSEDDYGDGNDDDKTFPGDGDEDDEFENEDDFISDTDDEVDTEPLFEGEEDEEDEEDDDDAEDGDKEEE